MEKQLEAKFRKAVRANGGLALKWVSPGYTGVPDRIVFYPNRRVFFVELKDAGKTTGVRQKIVHAVLKTFGYPVYVIDSEDSIGLFIAETAHLKIPY